MKKSVNSKTVHTKALHKLKNNLDEMQEQKMLKIEHNGCWLAFWGLFASMIIQSLAYGRLDWKYLAGEWIVFMCLALYIGIDCIRNGLWDRRFSPTPAVNLIASLLAGVVLGVFNFALSYLMYNELYDAAIVGIVLGLCGFGFCFMALTFCVSIYKKRVKSLEKEDDKET
ncbi:MAG: hypothetical protein J1D87_02040 [Lachnospiraceae bacterium]|nr:hypothetical protein [Lachnospiraceae bacterium]